MIYCARRAQEDFEDNHYDGMEKWEERSIAYYNKLYPPLTLGESLVQ